MNFWIRLGAISGFLAVLIGAMGAHALEPLMDNEGLSQFKTASLYHLTHSFALIAIGLLWPHIENHKKLKLSGYSFLVGILLFSGNLYILAILGTNPLHLLIPLGGLCLLLGWLSLAFASFKK
ncbi:DUF423 domain-containing protein [Pseudemcibacter aquimaris]|uniref:DUF423 domain-containing protein n=1 Tax=Pseudemcibacter aquimaris TaxID=2857064 RepID=UPI00201215A6|nr:DUF423 domain-containing protein [Pseudemcibacter aquimaris]MCC3862386.1 DUF423 domain-containing protein [Pseudemcibacter aquimaris]WDU59184.1 DUF423 domain-containing protein [Pseudemcibacter aquimaris]